MDFHRGWAYLAPEMMYNPSGSEGPFTANLSSYFRRPAKIVKPTSRNNSPRNLGRRRTTTTLPSSSSSFSSQRTRSVAEQHRSSRSSLQPQWPNSDVSRSRPVSWHPHSYDWNFSTNALLAQSGFPDPGVQTFTTTHVNGLVTPMAYPVMDEPQIQDLITPLEELSAQDIGYPYDGQMYHGQDWISDDHEKLHHPYFMNPFYPPNTTQEYWPYSDQPLTTNVPTAPCSPDFAPAPTRLETPVLTLDNTDDLSSGPETEELVGVGLYDSPAEVQSSSLFRRGSEATGKKALKLEDAFEPAEEASDEARDESRDQDQDGEQESMAPAESNASDGHMEKIESDGPMAFPSHSAPQCNDMTSLVANSFFGQHGDATSFTYLTDSLPINNVYQPAVFNGYGWI